MKTNPRLFIAGLLACALIFTAIVAAWALPFGSKDKDKDAKPGIAVSSGLPVIVELFTSEGCSSCPPADKALADLKRTQPVKGARILVLSEHVDYWNNLGWRDAFSSSSFTSRQGEYARKFQLDSGYTPQAVVDGQEQVTGSDRDNLELAVAKSARSSKSEVTLILEPKVPNKLRVAVSRPPTSEADVMLAITEDNLVSNVTRGENSGNQLSHVGVVRELRKIGTISGKETFTTTTQLDLRSSWKKDNLEAVVFVQEGNSRRIVGANALKLSTK